MRCLLCLAARSFPSAVDGSRRFRRHDFPGLRCRRQSVNTVVGARRIPRTGGHQDTGAEHAAARVRRGLWVSPAGGRSLAHAGAQRHSRASGRARRSNRRQRGPIQVGPGGATRSRREYQSKAEHDAQDQEQSKRKDHRNARGPLWWPPDAIGCVHQTSPRVRNQRARSDWVTAPNFRS